MPFGQLILPAQQDVGRLGDELLREWQHPGQQANGPVILLMEDETGLRPTHIYVIWEAWSGVDETERSRVILDAYESATDVARRLRVSIAMGLTPDEADRMGIRYQV